MKELIQFFIVLCFCILVSCHTKSIDFGKATQYLPAATWLSEGIVNKYYIHYKKNNSYNTATDIEYRSYQVGPNNELLYSYYNPALQQTVAKKYVFQNEQTLLKAEKRFGIKDTFTTNILHSIEKDWNNPKGLLEKTSIFNWGQRTWKSEQQAVRDSIVEGKPAKIFEIKTTYSQTFEETTTTNEMWVKEIHVQDLGLFKMEIIDSISKTEMELVEQMPLNKFKKMAQHNRKRVAYIDPDRIMDKETKFKPCGINNRIYDYYNGQKAYFYQGGKKEIWKTVKANLDTKKLFKESGYLTMRFIVNCEGETGYFTTEQADLDFQKKEFNTTTIDHFFQITQQLDTFNPTEIRGEKVDAYFYITYKLQDGVLIEILP